MPDETYIILFPEYEQLREEIKKLKTEFSMLVLDLDELRFVVCPNIKTAYQLAFGALELRVFDAYCLHARLRRMIEMIRARKNRREPVDVKEIENALDREFAEYLEQREEQLRALNEAIEHAQEDVLSGQETMELKKLYRTAVKALHPDLHPEQTPEEANLFLKAVSAFQNGDLRLMRVVCEAIGTETPQFSQSDTMEELRAERDRLKENLAAVLKEIEEIKRDYPYTLRNFVEDEQTAQEHKSSLKKTLTAYETANERLQKMIREMTENES